MAILSLFQSIAEELVWMEGRPNIFELTPDPKTLPRRMNHFVDEKERIFLRKSLRKFLFPRDSGVKTPFQNCMNHSQGAILEMMCCQDWKLVLSSFSLHVTSFDDKTASGLNSCISHMVCLHWACIACEQKAPILHCIFAFEIRMQNEATTPVALQNQFESKIKSLLVAMVPFLLRMCVPPTREQLPTALKDHASLLGW